MKKALTFLILLLIAAACQQPKFEVTKNLLISPELPGKGTELKLDYSPLNDMFAGYDHVSGIVYFFNDDMPVAKDIELKKESDKYTGKVKVDENYIGALLVFKAKKDNDPESEKMDNYDGKGYFVKLKSDLSEKEFVVAKLSATYGWARSFGEIDVDYAKMRDAYNAEFKKYPDLKPKYIVSFLRVLNRSMGDMAQEVVSAEVTVIEKKENPTVQELEALLYWTKKLNNKADVTPILDKLIKADPKSKYAYESKVKEIAGFEDGTKYAAELTAFEKEYGEDACMQVHNTVLRKFYGAGKFEEMGKYVDKYPVANDAGMMNSVAYKLSQDKSKLDLAAAMAEKGLKVGEEEITKMTKKPEYYSPATYKENAEYTYAMLADTYGYIKEKQGDDKTALKYFAKAYGMSGGAETEINNNYTNILVKTGNNDKAFEVISDCIKAGKSDKGMEENLKKAYVAVKGSEKGLESYMNGLNSLAKKSLTAKIQDNLVNEPAPTFTLKDLEGKDVSLADFKGKNVIIDFWATWCGPCRRSFPSMQEAQAKFTDVQFLYVNAWERVKDRKKNAADFIKKNNYPFTVLLDESDKVITSYKVSGIPTKFFVDKNGNIRYKSEGSAGSTEDLIKEMEIIFAEI